MWTQLKSGVRPCKLRNSLQLTSLQRSALKSMGKSSNLLVMSVGLGKTLVALEWALSQPREGSVLYVCPSHALYSTASQLPRFYVDESVSYTVVSSKVAYRRIVHIYDIIFVTYSVVSTRCCQDCRWGAIIFDESHLIRDQRSRRTKACQALDGNRVLAMSATPFYRSYGDIIPQLRVVKYPRQKLLKLLPRVTLNKLDAQADLAHVVKQYGSPVGRLIRTCVMYDLGPQEQKKYNVLDKMLTRPGSARNNILGKFLLHPGLVAYPSVSCGSEYRSSKVQRLTTLLSSGKLGSKIIVFCSCVAAAEYLCGEVDMHGQKTYTHSHQALDLCYRRFEQFKSNAKLRVMFTTLAVAGSAINLAYATDLVFMTTCVNMDTILQAEGRVRRISAPDHTCNVWHVIGQNTHEDCSQYTQ